MIPGNTLPQRRPSRINYATLMGPEPSKLAPKPWNGRCLLPWARHVPRPCRRDPAAPIPAWRKRFVRNMPPQDREDQLRQPKRLGAIGGICESRDPGRKEGIAVTRATIPFSGLCTSPGSRHAALRAERVGRLVRSEMAWPIRAYAGPDLALVN